MRKYFLVMMFFGAGSLFSQSLTVLEYSNSFGEIIERFQKIAKETSMEYNYFVSDMETKYTPVLDEKNKEIAGDDTYVIVGLESDFLDLNILSLFNVKNNEAIVFIFQKEYLEGLYPCTLLEMSRHLTYHIVRAHSVYKWE